ncbi:ABC transporter ATP-binding protein [Nocardioides solisilvae]|uniref:ABC transporter ATP-binding protein n=1 Tax=Nocardioides solisilvae TaxID=1542435 RepID=UPI000D74C16B|nr:ABC transporter ATP-binding protein [Nocardioides solisilvae]
MTRTTTRTTSRTTARPAPTPAAPDPHAPALEVRGLRRTYGSGDDAFEAVRGIDLTVPRGRIHALLGVNGAGKTSAMEVMEGLSPGSGGQVRVLGLDPVADRAEVRRRTGVLLQRSGFVGDLTVRETLRMWAATVTRARPVEESLEMLDLARVADTRMRALSGGEHRRVDLACALTGHPELVMLDEPTTGLDPESRRAVWALVRRLRTEGATVLLTTHYLEEAEALADHVSIMRAGEVVREGTLAEIVAGHPAEISFRTPADEPALPAGVTASRDGDRTVLRCADLQPALTELLVGARDTGVVLELLQARTATLESVFLELAAAPAHDLEGATR